MRKITNLDRQWYFYLGEEPRAVNPRFDHSTWRLLDVPHDWSIEASPHPGNPAGGNGGFFPGGIGWYRKELAIPADLSGNEVLIEFDGIYMNSEVYCNGRFCGRRPYGYSSFQYNLTPFIIAGETAVIAVRADNSRQKNSRWYTGSGIYRHVRLVIAAPVRVGHWGVAVSTPKVSQAEALLKAETTIVNHGPARCELAVRSDLISSSGEPEGSAENRGFIEAGGSLVCESEIQISRPRLWSPEQPELYILKTSVLVDGTVVDTVETRCGIRSTRFDADWGFFLNGENIKLKGVNEHHDAGCLGAAVPDDVLRRRFSILKRMGCNAIRVAHNPASPIFLDLCDEMGFMVIEDAFDDWKEGKTDFGYQLYWEEWWERDLTDMIRRDRNHPSVIMWSVGNEIIEVREGKPEGLPIMRALADACHRTDPTRPMTCGCNAIRKTNAGGYGPLMDVVGYNGGGGSCFDYEKDHKTYPERVIFASEVPHTLQTRGVYRTRTWYRDLAKDPNVERMDVPHLMEHEVFEGFDGNYLSSYDNAMVRISAIDSWRLTSTLPFMCGEFRWSGFDYIGETPGWPAKSWNYGVIDLCGFPKDTYYFYKSQWNPEPMVHILPHWTWPGLEGVVIPVIAYSNCREVELFLDDESLGRKTMGDEMYLRWDVLYRPGTLRAVGYNGMQPSAECRHVAAGKPAALRLDGAETEIRADGTGIVHAAVTVVDSAGSMVPYADNGLAFRVAGEGRLTGLENGDPIDTANYQINSRRAFNGMALAIIRSNGNPGQIRITVTAEGLEPAVLEIRAV